MEELLKFRNEEMGKYKQKPDKNDRRRPDLENAISSENSIFIRTEFSRDRDRIKFSRAFRRLEHKAQIYSHAKGDHFRTRLTHTLEVSQISRSIAQNMGLNDYLVDAITLGHDIGHTPFGHQGERTLDDIMSGKDNLSGKIKYSINYGGFKHNFNSLKILDQMEVKHQYYKGINLTWQVMEGILKHTKIRRHKKDECTNCGGCWDIKRFVNDENFIKKFLEYDFSVTLEGQVVAVADEIAQRQHDIDDGLMDKDLGLDFEDVAEYFLAEFGKVISKLDEDEIKENNLEFYVQKLKNLMEYIKFIHKEIRIEREELYKISALSSKVLNFFIKDVTANSLENLKNIKSENIKREDGKLYFTEKVVDLSLIGKKVNKIIESYIKRKILNSYNVNRFDGKSTYIIKQLFKAYYTNPRQMPEHTLIRLLNMVRVVLKDTYNLKFADGEKVKNINFTDSNPKNIKRLVELMKLKINLRELCIPEELEIEEFKNKGYIEENGKFNIVKLGFLAKESNNKKYKGVDAIMKALVEINYCYLSVICDNIAGMTDNFAANEFKNLYLVE